MRSVKRLVGGLVVLGSVCSGGMAQAATYYVSKSGSDNRSCAQAQSASTPRLSVNGGIGCLVAGDTLLVRGGTYDEGISWVPSGTSWSNKVRIANYPGETVWLTPLSTGTSAGGINVVIWLDGNFTYVEFDGINLDGRNVPGGPSLWVSTNNGSEPTPHSLPECGGHRRAKPGRRSLGAHRSGLRVQTRLSTSGFTAAACLGCAVGNVPLMASMLAASGNLIDGCDIYDTSGAGVHIYNGAAVPDNNIVRNNRIHDITRTGSLGQVWGIIDHGAQ